MSHELSQRFFFEAAHTLRRQHETESSRRIHGHTYLAEVSVRGTPDATTGMVMDLAVLRAAIAQVREQLDHRFLDEVAGLGPATLENLGSYVLRELQGQGLPIHHVTIRREASGDSCTVWAQPG